MIRRLRLLSVLVAVATLALAARLGDVWEGFAVLAQDKLLAESSTSRPTAWDGATAQGAEPPAEGGDAAMSDAASSVPDPAATQDVFQLPPDPLTMTDEEVDLLQALAERRDEIERRASRVEEREALLQAAERRIEEKVDDLKALQKRIEVLLKQYEEQTESQYRSLVKIYENMKPKDAARIFEELDMDVLLPVVERMKERKTAPILAEMNADKAKAITTELAQRRLLVEAN